MNLVEKKTKEINLENDILYLDIVKNLIIVNYGNKIFFINLKDNSIFKEYHLEYSPDNANIKIYNNYLLLLISEIAMINTNDFSIEFLLEDKCIEAVSLNKDLFVIYEYINKEIEIYSLKTKNLYKKFGGINKDIGIYSTFISNDNKTLLSASIQSNEVTEWSIEEEKINYTFVEKTPQASIQDLFLTPDNKYLVCGINDDMVDEMTWKNFIPFCSVWDFENKKHLYNLGKKLNIKYDIFSTSETIVYKLDYLYNGKLTVAYTRHQIIIFETSDCKVYKIIDVFDGLFAVDKQENCIAYRVKNLDEKGQYLGTKIIISKIELIED